MMPGKIDWLASYPKSGNTWMRMLLANYFSETDSPHDINTPGVTNGIAALRRRFDELLGVTSSDMTSDEVRSLQPNVYNMLAAGRPEHQWMKVHDAQAKLPDGRWLFPPSVSGVVIYIIRNPLDVAVSSAFHDGHGNMDEAAEKLCNVDTQIARKPSTQLPQFIGDWQHHVKSWADQKEIPVLVVRYEDMLADTARELARVIAFARPDCDIDHTRIEAAVDNTAFERLQAVESGAGFVEKPPEIERFFRNGKAGDWRNHLTMEQTKRICAQHGDVMSRFSYDVETYLGECDVR